MDPSSHYRLVRISKRTRKEVLHSGSGRYHEVGDAPTTYLADRPITAKKEIEARAGVHLNPHGFHLWKVILPQSSPDLLDVSSVEARRQAGVTLDELTSIPPMPEGLAFARAMRLKGIPGFVYPSVRNRPSGICVVLFLENTGDDFEIVRADDEWRRFLGGSEKS